MLSLAKYDPNAPKCPSPLTEQKILENVNRALVRENQFLQRAIRDLNASSMKERAELYEACVYNDGGARAKMTAAIQEELMKKHFETAVEWRSKYDRLQEDLKSSWGPAAYAKLQEEVQYWKDVSRDLHDKMGEVYQFANEACRGDEP